MVVRSRPQSNPFRGILCSLLFILGFTVFVLAHLYIVVVAQIDDQYRREPSASKMLLVALRKTTSSTTTHTGSREGPRAVVSTSIGEIALPAHTVEDSDVKQMREHQLPAIVASAAAGWQVLLSIRTSVEFMTRRWQDRKESWLQALYQRPHHLLSQGSKVNALPKAFVWPYAPYKHFGTKAVWSLGEYAQWADLCAALATLGVEVHLHPAIKAPPTSNDWDEADFIFVDYDGLHAAYRSRTTGLPPPHKTWLLDTFGTDGTVVDHPFFGRQAPLTNYPLHRFLTLTPGYSKMNTFLGVAAVDPYASKGQGWRRQWQCVLWSKVHPWLNTSHGFPAYHAELLNEYSKHCHVIATIDANDTYGSIQAIRACCPDVEIQYVKSPEEFRRLLGSSAVYVGVGEPLISPSCFEALGLGTHVVQPRFPKPRVLKNKPITQAWTSQHPHLETIPEPFAFTVDPSNPLGIAAAFRRIKALYEAVHNSAACVGPCGVDLPAISKFYRDGIYPGNDAYSVLGFLERVENIKRATVSLSRSDWDFERKDHPGNLPPHAQ